MNPHGYEAIFSLISKGELRDASSLFGKIEKKEPEHARATYLLSSNRSSPLFDVHKANESLQELVDGHDVWGMIEKGSVLLSGKLSPALDKDTFQAEDVLRKAHKKEKENGMYGKATFLLAEMLSKGFHVNEDNEPFFDFKDAKKLYDLVYMSKSALRTKASIGYCRCVLLSGYDVASPEKHNNERIKVLSMLLEMRQLAEGVFLDDVHSMLSRFYAMELSLIPNITEPLSRELRLIMSE